MTDSSPARGVRARLAQTLYALLLVLAASALTARAQSFSAPIHRDVGFNPYAVAVGDFNADTRLDVAVANAVGDSVTIALGNGDGTFVSSIEYNTGDTPEGVAVGDFNKDGKLDVAVGNIFGGPSQAGTVSVLFGNGDGTAQAAVNYNVGTPQGLVAADLNSDGNLDLVTASTNSDKASVLLGNANGTFNAAVAYTVGTHPAGVAVADYNNDGKLDMVTANFDGFSLSILLGNGDGTFQAATNLTTSPSMNRPGPLTAADLNADGKMDLVVPSAGEQLVGVLLGNGNGTFQSPVTYPTTADVYFPQTADFNDDGKLDVALTNVSGPASVSVLRGNGDGTLQAPLSFPTQNSVWGLLATDLNKDGKPDLITTNQTIGRINVLLNSPSARGTNFTAVATLPASGVLVATFTDFDTTKTAASFTASINWGDATPAGAGTVTANAGGGFDVTGTHTYAAPGLYTVTVQVADTSGNFANATSRATVAKRDQTITFDALPNKTFGNADFTVSAAATSGLTVSFAADGQCTVSGTTVHLTGAGSCTITASQAGDGVFNAAPSVQRTFQIAKADQTITFGVLSDRTFGDADFGVSATATSGLAVSFAAAGSCSVTGSTVRITGAGSCTVTASQAGSANFNAAPEVPRTFQIAKASTATAVATSVSPAAVGQSVTLTATVTSAAGTPTGTVQFKVDGVDFGAPVALGAGGTASLSTTALTQGQHAVTVVYGGDANFNTSAGALAGVQIVGAVVEFTQPSYDAFEPAGSLTVTVRRTGDTSGPAAVDYATEDGTGIVGAAPCSALHQLMLDRCDFTRALGTLHFAAGETEKTITVIINDDSYYEGTETAVLRLSAPSAGVFLGPQADAWLLVTDQLPESAINPIDDDETFVRQHYRDFLNRVADADGLKFWTDGIKSCGADAGCRQVKRIDTSAAFFLSIEFQQTGYLAYLTHKAAYGDATSPNVAGTVPAVRLNEFLTDTQRIGRDVIVNSLGWEQKLEANKQAYALEFVRRARFNADFPATLTAAEFVSKLDENAGGVLTADERAQLVAALGATPSDAAKRAAALRQVAEHAQLRQREFNRAFVLMQYYGYLRRDPDTGPNTDFTGWKFWLDKLNQFDGDYRRAEMVKAFLESIEYRQRFGQ